MKIYYLKNEIGKWAIQWCCNYNPRYYDVYLMDGIGEHGKKKGIMLGPEADGTSTGKGYGVRLDDGEYMPCGHKIEFIEIDLRFPHEANGLIWALMKYLGESNRKN